MNPFKKGFKYFKGFLPRTLMGRSLLILVTPIFLVQIITSYIFFDRHWQTMSNRLAFALAGEIALMADVIERNDSPQNLYREQAAAGKSLDLAVTYKKGDRLERVFKRNSHGFQNPSRENIITEALDRAFRMQLKRPFALIVDADEKWVETRVQLKNGVMTVVMPERRIFSSTGYVVLLWMVGSSIILLIIATIFMRNQVRPIMKLAVAAERIGKGRDVPVFKMEGAREVRQAAKAFMQMKERLQRQIQQRTAMLAGVSHDLRTPLTRMKLQLELMEGNQDVHDLRADLADMEKMIEAYLQFARGEGNEELIRTDLLEIVAQIVRAANREEERAYLSSRGDLTMPVRPVAFTRCVENIIGNAVKYGHHAWISLQRFGDTIELCVDDDGPGIAPETYDDVFKPFYRGEDSRNSKTGGVGLGLPIAQEIVHAHGGQIWLDKSPRGGLRVVVDLPL